MTQCERILNHMKISGSITQLDALKEFGCMRLAARIADLRAEGYHITKTMEHRTNRYGEPVSYARYKLSEEHND